MSAPAGRITGDIHMWVMVLGDLFFFGCYFLTYMVFRARSPELFAAGQRQLHLGIGVVNTVVLLTASLFAALAVLEVRRGAVRATRRWLLAAGGCGVLFAALKGFEWQHALAAGHTVADEFFSFYYVLTGVHLAHLLLGLLILGIVARAPRVGPVEQGALYWHMVDLLWIVIFAILYLLR
ncbi:cytochrome c oxidase subunit 3 [Nocardia sp. NPDC057353]|uniref:cytochrome c oxidase subunit 3 n=1 Tax=Nocardia sp. NPDC057353 TaxID=3346104 RepID=UPI0036298E14